ncbi:hypothetical protein SAMN05444159_3442 [Bradyrhizobium lablabi]|uniref:Uncharacterized protein n=1 Tax=Bradyrhizobium lablabi TaxID=722472 RepID=A0A1M6T285_9BRAD|nr:hypothetical protein [Bradyrhizobium lablabi]SHK51040.1 hypothetical protein SAMN05444159_3442 [Bradyrhizobium lablabi]
MSKSHQSANRATRLYDLQSRSIRVDLRDRPNMMHDGLMRAPRLDGTERLDRTEARSQPSVMGAVTRSDRQHTTLWSSPILAFFMEGFALYGASYHAYPHAAAASPVEPSAVAVRAPEPDEISWRARRRAMAIVVSAMDSGVAEVEDEINRAGSGSETASGNVLSDTDGSTRRSWLAKAWRALAGRWAQRRRAREIKKAVAALLQPDRRASRNFGIPNRSGIAQVTRYRRDC